MVIYHAGRNIEPSLIPFAGLGNTGVTFFFVLSGFVLAWTARGDDRPSHFYWRRFARVWPLHLTTTLIALLLMVLWSDKVSWPLLVLTLLMLQAWLPPNDWHYGFNQVSWSLSAEAFFYAVFPLFARSLLTSPTRARVALAVVPALMVAVAAAVLSVLPSKAGFLLFVNPAYRFGEFVIGVALASLIRSGWRPPLSLRGATACVALTYCAGMVFAHVAYGNPLRMPIVVGDLLMLPGLALLISAAAVHELDGAPTWLAAKPLVRLGEWSFALYLIHDLLLRAAAHVEWTWLPTPVLISFSVAAAIILSAVLHVGIERPAERWLRGRIRRSDPQVRAKPTSVGVG